MNYNASISHFPHYDLLKLHKEKEIEPHAYIYCKINLSSRPHQKEPIDDLDRRMPAAP